MHDRICDMLDLERGFGSHGPVRLERTIRVRARHRRVRIADVNLGDCDAAGAALEGNLLRESAHGVFGHGVRERVWTRRVRSDRAVVDDAA